MAIASPETPKRDPSPIRNLSFSKRVKCTKDQIFGESDLKKTCHQCRQSRKRSDFYVATCKNLKKKNTICSINFCSKCLFNRYGERAEGVVLLSDWKCPKCRDICNC